MPLSCPGAAPEVPPKGIKQNELGCLDNMLTGTGGQADGQDHVLSQSDALTKILNRNKPRLEAGHFRP